MEAEDVILLGSKMWMCLVCIRERVGGGRCEGGIFVYVFLFCVPPFFLWLRSCIGPWRAPCFFMI